MSRNDRVEYNRKLYNDCQTSWPQESKWHTYTHNYATQFVNDYLKDEVTPQTVILNAGSGETAYNIRGKVYNCDIAEGKISQSENPIIASIEDLPCEDAFFDYVICVGSVINYCDAFAAIGELSRVLKSKGQLILEFERSESGEFLFTREYGRSVTQHTYQYNSQQHRLWLYSEQYIKDIFECNHLQFIYRERFHTVSGLLSRFFDDEKIAGFSKFDSLIPNIISHYWAHNTIMICQKI